MCRVFPFLFLLFTFFFFSSCAQQVDEDTENDIVADHPQVSPHSISFYDLGSLVQTQNHWRPDLTSAAAQLLSAINFKENPCEDFYEFACGRWLERNAIAEGENRVNELMKTRDKVRLQMRGSLFVVEEAADLLEDLIPSSSVAINKLRILYSACLDEEERRQLNSSLPEGEGEVWAKGEEVEDNATRLEARFLFLFPDCRAANSPLSGQDAPVEEMCARDPGSNASRRQRPLPATSLRYGTSPLSSRANNYRPPSRSFGS